LAVALAPESNFLWLNLADALLYSGADDEAMAAFRQSATLAEANLAVNGNDTERLYELAWAREMTGDSVKARELIARSLALDSENPYAHYYDGLIKNHVGRQDEAIEAFAMALEGGYPVIMLRSEPHLADLRESAKFTELIEDSS
jgi:tetratricopeptide (TPR) repeat protein